MTRVVHPPVHRALSRHAALLRCGSEPCAAGACPPTSRLHIGMAQDGKLQMKVTTLITMVLVAIVAGLATGWVLAHYY